ncbi:MAG: tRNA pseudouridine(13) synthase TruD [Promethearchaeota archaeon]
MHSQNNPTYSFRNNNRNEVEKFVGIESYSTSDFNGIGGVYKTDFKDFIVKEIDKAGKILNIKTDSPSPSFSADLADKFTTFNLIKINRDTFEASRQISKALGIPYTSLNYSGLKDKQSISVQKISVKGNHIEKLKNLKIPNIYIRNIHPSKKPLKLGSHLGNNFTVVIRNIEASKNLKENIENLLGFINQFGIPNYYGLQRFGYFRPNSHIVGRFLLEGEYEKAFNEYVLTTYSTESIESLTARNDFQTDRNLGKAYKNFPKGLQYEKNMILYLIENPQDYFGAINTLSIDLRRLLKSSFQSYLFNKMLSIRVKRDLPLFKPIKGDVISIRDDYHGNITQVKYIYGGVYDIYLNRALELNRASIVIPIIGNTTNLDDFPLMQSIYNEMAETEKFDKHIFRSDLMNNEEFKGSIRAMTVKPTELKLIELTDDELNPQRKKLKIEFSLQKGSYATMLLRELIKMH